MTGNRPPIEQQITFLPTSDLAETARFHEQILGLPLKVDQGVCRIYQVTQGAYLGFCQQADAHQHELPSGTRQVILTLVTQRVDEWYAYLQDRGVPFEKPPAVNQKYDIYHCFLRDPNGYLLEIQRFLHSF